MLSLAHIDLLASEIGAQTSQVQAVIPVEHARLSNGRQRKT
jgi:hypothetical protein